MAEDPSTIRKEIAGTREELAGTVQGLVEKADVKRRVQDSVREGTVQLQHRASEVGKRARDAAPEKAKEGASVVQDQVHRQPWVLAVAGVVAAAGAALAVRRRRSK